jgi:uncharacterized protein (DUF58 family)
MIPNEILAKVRQIEIYTHRLVNDVMAGSYHSTFKGRGMEFEDVREYNPGDDVRSIDWNVTARTGAPYIKRFREERELTVMLMVDLSGSTDFGTTEQTKGELTAEICALLAFSAIKNNDRVGLLIFTHRVEKFIPPKKGKNHVLRVVREVLFHKAYHRGTSIPVAVEHIMKVLKRKSVVFLLSDFLPGTALRRPLAALNNRHDLIALKIRDAREFDMPAMGLVQFHDPETGETFFVDTFDARFRKGYKEVTERANKGVSHLFKQLKIDSVEVQTGQPYIEAMVQLFKRRALRQ